MNRGIASGLRTRHDKCILYQVNNFQTKSPPKRAIKTKRIWMIVWSLNRVGTAGAHLPLFHQMRQNGLLKFRAACAPTIQFGLSKVISSPPLLVNTEKAVLSESSTLQ